MRKIIFHTVFFLFCFSHWKISAQQKNKTDIAVVSFVTNGAITLRWAPANAELLKTGIATGYKIQRIPVDVLKENVSDVPINANTSLVTLQPLKPWNKDDERWKRLLGKNSNATLIYNFIYKTNASANKTTNEAFFGMVLKACDLYPELAKAMGLYFRDSLINENEKYVYRVSFWEEPQGIKYIAGMAGANAKENTKLKELNPIKAKFGDRRVVISIPTADTKESYSGFWLERSEDSVNFYSINKSPIVHTTTKYDEKKIESLYPDSLPVNDKKFYYRVRGISYFGSMGPPSNIVSGKGKIEFVAYPIIDSTIIVKNKSVQIKFSMPEKFDLNSLRGFLILRGEKRNEVFTALNKNLLAPQEKIFTDYMPIDAAYYKICAVNKNGDSTFSFATYAKIIDEIPPLVPEGLAGKIDSNGIVTLSWHYNCEPDLLGYRVFRCNHEKEQPVEITKRIVTGLIYTDTVNLKTLTREVYYTLRAVDKVHNNSGYTPPCKLMRPDKIAPIAPVFIQTQFSDSTIKLNWIVSSSKDVAAYTLKRNNSMNGEWKVISYWRAADSLRTYFDTAVKMGETYSYRLEVSDDSKNVSYSNSPSIVFQPAFAPKIKYLKAGINTEKRNILLSWKYEQKGIFNYTIYKAKGDEALRVFKTLDASRDSFTDNELYPNTKYRYSIKATFNSGVESKMSDVIVADF